MNPQEWGQEPGRQPWAPPVITRFAIDRTQFGGGSPTDGSSSAGNLT